MCNRVLKALLDEHIEAHKWCAYMICLQTYIHFGAHCFNVMRLTESRNSPDELLAALNNLTDDPVNGGTYLNPIPDGDINYIASVFRLFGGWTGIVITLALLWIVTSAQEAIRRSFFELFWITHHLFVIFFAFLFVHGIGRQIRGQTNVVEHNPSNCSDSPATWGTSVGCPMPTFAGSDPGTWKWILGPVLLYFLERLLRFFHSLNPSEVTKVVFHPNRVIEIQMKKSKWSARGNDNEVGEYVFLNCRQVSRLEWHPFTLTSAPEEDRLSVHIRIVGDWTGSQGSNLPPQNSSLLVKAYIHWL